MDLEPFIQKYINYAVLHQTCADRLREFGFDYACDVYREEQKKWYNDPSNPLVEVKPHEVERRDRYLAKCDQICQSDPKTPQEYVVAVSCPSSHMDPMTSRSYCLVSFASYAGMALIICGVFDAFPDGYNLKHLDRANRLACGRSFLMQILLTSLRK